MRLMSDEATASLTGSRVGDRLIAHAWYDGALTAPDLPVSEFTVVEDLTRQVRTRVSLRVDDPDGRLAPWAINDPLGVAGNRLQLIYELAGGFRVQLGWYVITRSVPTENWRLLRLPGPSDFPPNDMRLEWVSGGATIPVTGEDLTQVVVADRLLTPESPQAGATVMDTVRDLLDSTVGVGDLPEGVTDRPAPASMIFERERMNAVEDLLDHIGCTHRMSADGLLEALPLGEQASVWEIAGGPDGVMVSMNRTLDQEGLYNIAVSTGTTVDGKEIVGRYVETEGPLAFDGPLGRRPVFHASEFVKTQAAADADSKTLLTNQIAARTVELTVTCLPHPGLQAGDWVSLRLPTLDGQEAHLPGQVITKTLRGTKRSGISPMVLDVVCDFALVQSVMRRVVPRA